MSLDINYKLKNVFSSLTPTIAFENLIKTTSLSELPKFDREQVLDEAKFLQKPLQKGITVQTIQQRIDTRTWNKVACFALSCFTWPFNFISLPNRPRGFTDLLYVFYPYQMALFSPLKKVWKKSSKFFGDSTYKVTALVVTLVALCILAKCIEKWSGITRSVDLDEKSYCNLNAEVKDNKIHPLTTQRSEQIQQIAICLVDADLETKSDKFPILVGPPGTGKTASVSNLVYQIQKLNKYPELKGKTFYAINAAYWANGDKPPKEIYDSSSDNIPAQPVAKEPLFALLGIIEGAEKDTVLFFDEAHCLSSTCIELLKTYMVERQLKVIFATTENEYHRTFEKNLGFADRLKKIEFPSLSDGETKVMLQELFAYENTKILIDDAFNAIIQAGHELKDYKERANPRKSIQLMELVIQAAKQWVPTKVLSQAQAKEQGMVSFRRSVVQKIFTSEQTVGESSTILQREQSEIDRLEEKMNQINDLYQRLRNLQNYQWKQQQSLCEIVHKINEQTGETPEQDQKRYLINKLVLRALNDLLKEKAEEFQELSEEKFPLSITADLVNKFLYSK